MHLSDLTFYANGPLLGSDQSLTVVTDTPQVSSQWLLEWLVDENSVFVSFCRDKPKTNGQFLDLGQDLFGSGSRFTRPDLQAMTAKIAACNKKTVVLQYPTILLLANMAHHQALLELIQSLLDKCRVVVAIELSKATIESQLPISQQLTQFVRALMHQASLVLTLRPFPTGRADDVTGVFRVSAGPRDLTVKEKEFLYSVGKQVVLTAR